MAGIYKPSEERFEKKQEVFSSAIALFASLERFQKAFRQRHEQIQETAWPEHIK